VKVSRGTGNAVKLEEFVDIGQQRNPDLPKLVVAMNDRSAGNVAAASREELRSHRAYQEAPHLFRVHICQNGVRRLAIGIKEIGHAMHGG
jgi:hypothetical protein